MHSAASRPIGTSSYNSRCRRSFSSRAPSVGQFADLLVVEYVGDILWPSPQLRFSIHHHGTTEGFYRHLRGTNREGTKNRPKRKSRYQHATIRKCASRRNSQSRVLVPVANSCASVDGVWRTLQANRKGYDRTYLFFGGVDIRNSPSLVTKKGKNGQCTRLPRK